MVISCDIAIRDRILVFFFSLALYILIGGNTMVILRLIRGVPGIEVDIPAVHSKIIFSEVSARTNLRVLVSQIATDSPRFPSKPIGNGHFMKGNHCIAFQKPKNFRLRRCERV